MARAEAAAMARTVELEENPLLPGDGPAGSRPRKGPISVILTLASLTGLGAVALMLLEYRQMGGVPYDGEIHWLNASGVSRGLDDVQCAAYSLEEDFGSGQVTKVQIPKGKGKGERACPPGSANPNGKIMFQCSASGMWRVAHTCFNCAARRDVAKLHGKQRSTHLPPAMNGEVRKEECSFEGTKYDRGHITYKCEHNHWASDIACTNKRCRAGTLSVNFYGGMGEVLYQVAEGEGKVSLECPSGAADPHGKVHVECGPAPAGEIGDWVFVSQTCQVCNPSKIDIEFEGHPKSITLEGGELHSLKPVPCNFDDGKNFRDGKIVYKCTNDGWEAQQASCNDWDCPAQHVSLHVSYQSDGVEVTGKVPARIGGGFRGSDKSIPCPKGTLDPSGQLTFKCTKEFGWQLSRAECGNGVQQLA